MRIAQTQNGHYVKILSPQTRGLVTRLYQEVNERKLADKHQEETTDRHAANMEKITSKMEDMLTRYAEITEILRNLFPDGEPTAHIDRALVVNGSVKATTFVSTEKIRAPLKVESKAQVDNLNAEYLSGRSITDLNSDIVKKVSEEGARLDGKLTELDTANKKNFAPMSHVNAGGVGVHPYATIDAAGFMSPADKLRWDRINLPAGISIGDRPPEAPRLMQVWIDTN